MPALLLGSISTVADTSELQRAAFNDAFAAHGLDWHWDRDAYRALLAGSGGAQRIADVAASRGETVDAAAVHATKSQLFQERLAAGGVPAREGVADTVRAARAQGWQVAFVTTTSRANVDAVLGAVGDALPADAFDLVLDVDQVAHPKPDPEAYELALRVLGVDAQDCVAVEDNEGGLRAARAAGVPAVAFPNVNTSGLDAGDAPVVDALSLDALRRVTPAR